MDPENDTEVLEPPANPEDTTADPQKLEDSPADPAADPADPPADEEEVIVSIGDEPTADPEDNEEELRRAPEWVRELRKSKKEADRRAREAEREKKALAEELERIKNGGKSGVTLGEKPTLEACDFDTERFERELTAWHERKRAADAEEEKKRKAVEAEQQAWQARQDAYTKAKTDLKVKDFDDAESVVTTALNVTQQGMILHGADNPALVVYALGKNPKKAAELAAIADPVKFAFAVAKLETQLKVTSRRTPPPPEKEVRGSAPISGTVDSELERLRAEADRTGDRSKIAKYLREKRRA